MAELNLAILNAAFEDGLFKRPLTSNRKLYVVRSIATASSIITAIDDRGDDGIGVAALADAVGINENTAKIYCRWLRKKGLIGHEVEENSQGSASIYYSIKPRLLRAQK
jgi:DNA-binding IclR family transcriptional regulator